MATRTHISPTEIEKNLAGIDYPADKQTLLKYAKKKGSSEDIIGALDSLPDRVYSNSTDVSSELSSDSDGAEKESMDETEAV